MLARWVSPAEYGVFAITFSLFLLVSGLHVALILEPMNVLGAARPVSELGRYIGSLVQAHFLLTAPISLILAAAAVVARDRNASLAGALGALAAVVPFLLLQWLLRQACYVQTRPDLAVRGSLVYVVALAATFAVLSPVTGMLGPLQAAFPALGVASLAAAVALWRPLRVSLPAGSPLPRDLVRGAAAVSLNAGTGRIHLLRVR